MSNDFDLHAVLTGRKYPTGFTHVWFDEEDWYALAALEKRHASLPAEDPELKSVERQIAETQRHLEESAYTVHVRGISPRAGEDILSAALAEFPIKRDLYGREDDAQAMKRRRHIAVLSFAAHITKLVNPDGGEIVFTDDDKFDRANMIFSEAPETAIKKIDTAIAAVSHDFTEQQARFTSPDFS